MIHAVILAKAECMCMMLSYRYGCSHPPLISSRSPCSHVGSVFRSSDSHLGSVFPHYRLRDQKPFSPNREAKLYMTFPSPHYSIIHNKPSFHHHLYSFSFLPNNLQPVCHRDKILIPPLTLSISGYNHYNS